MNVLIVGNNEANGYLGRRLRDEGFAVDTIADPCDIDRVRRRDDEYIVITAEKEYSASSVIITEKPTEKDAEFFGTKTLNIADAGILESLKAVKGRARIVFMLDLFEETPEYLTAKALETAKALANAKKDVFFVSMFVKAASDGTEQLYLEARQSGVTFLKFESVNLNYNDEQGRYIIKVSDGVLDTVIETPWLVTAGGTDFSSLSELGRKFRLTCEGGDEGGIASEFKYFLNPGLTTRKGIFYFSPGMAGTEVCEGLDRWLPVIINEIKQISKPADSGVHAHIDVQKCAFCYTCYRACRHAALEPDTAAGAMMCVENACMACGACAAICPGNAISMVSEEEGLTADTIGSGRLTGCKVFCCENSAAVVMNEIACELGEDAEKLSFSEIPCGGRLGQEVITAALTVYGKVLVAVCIDDACRHIDGGKRACKQVERVIAMLEKSGLYRKKVKCVKVSHAMPNVLEENVKSFLKESLDA